MNPGVPLGHLNGLDGLRALAAVAVVAFHTRLPGLTGGFLGVDVFFVLSGFLTTSIALSGRYSVGAFMARRLLRLWPLMLAFGIVATATHLMIYAEPPRAVAPSMLFAVDFITASEGPIGWMTHFWTLALEFRLYILICVLAAALDRRSFYWVTLALFVATTAYRISVADDFRFGFYSFASHSSGLFLGAAVAARPVVIGRTAFIVSAVALLVLFSSAPFWSSVSLLALITITEISAAAVILHLAASRQQTILDQPVMARLGELSFGIYVWHYPIALLSRDLLPSPIAFGITLCLSVCLAAASLRYVERPVRSAFWRAQRTPATAKCDLPSGLGNAIE